jgi:hypothetical protein
MGSGGVLGTIFVWPKIDELPGDLEYRGELEGMESPLLTPGKDALGKKWFELYHQKMISSGEFWICIQRGLMGRKVVQLKKRPEDVLRVLHTTAPRLGSGQASRFALFQWKGQNKRNQCPVPHYRIGGKRLGQ